MRTIRVSAVRGMVATALTALALLPLAGATHAASAAGTEVEGANIVANGGFERSADPGSKLAIPAGSPLLDGWTAANEVAIVGTYWQPKRVRAAWPWPTTGRRPRPAAPSSRPWLPHPARSIV